MIELEGDDQEPPESVLLLHASSGFQFVSLWVVFSALLLSIFYYVHGIHNLEIPGIGSADPFYPNSPSRRRFLPSKSDFNYGLNDLRKVTKDFFTPNPDLFGGTTMVETSKALYPFNISGSFIGYGRINYTESLIPYSELITTAIRIRTYQVSDNNERYHVAQIHLILTPTKGAGLISPAPRSKSWRPSLMLQATGIYDTFAGHLQAETDSGTLRTSLREELNLTYPIRQWPKQNRKHFHPSNCLFVVDIFPDPISEEEFKREQAGRVKSDEAVGAYSPILDRKYIDVHMTADIRSLNQSCTNVTGATMEVDLLRYDIFILKARRYALAASCFSFVQLLLIFYQMKYSTPTNNAAKLSLASLAMHSVFDAYVCSIHLTTALYVDDLFNAFIMVSFMQFMLFSMFDFRLVLLVWRARRPMDFSGWERMRAALSKIYSGFYGGVSLCLIILYFLRHQMKLIVFVLFSFWAPQVIRNVVTGEKNAVKSRYLLGITAIRLFFPLYAFGCPKNFLDFPTNLVVCIGLVVWSGIQVFVLRGQDKWGSRFFIPKWLQPDYYNYHIKFNPERDENCAICMNDFLSTSENSKGAGDETEGLLNRILTTPCGHHFCRDCLTRWMETKMICPTCRQPLPPYNL